MRNRSIFIILWKLSLSYWLLCWSLLLTYRSTVWYSTNYDWKRFLVYTRNVKKFFFYLSYFSFSCVCVFYVLFRSTGTIALHWNSTFSIKPNKWSNRQRKITENLVIEDLKKKCSKPLRTFFILLVGVSVKLLLPFHYLTYIFLFTST